jgi:transposase
MERDEWLRTAWRVMVAEEIDARRLVFVDEMGANTSLSPLYASGLRRLERGRVVIMDNLSAHKGDRVKELIEERGCQLLYLPPYSSPDFNPIEEVFSKLTSLLRKAQARTRETLVEAMGAAISAITAEDARGFFEHCVGTPRRFNRYDERCKCTSR